MDDLVEFIERNRQAYTKATGQIPNDDIISRYALALQLEVLNQNLDVISEHVQNYMTYEGIYQLENEDVEKEGE
jgi:hypothetical protein